MEVAAGIVKLCDHVCGHCLQLFLGLGHPHSRQREKFAGTSIYGVYDKNVVQAMVVCLPWSWEVRGEGIAKMPNEERWGEHFIMAK